MTSQVQALYTRGKNQDTIVKGMGYNSLAWIQLMDLFVLGMPITSRYRMSRKLYHRN